MREITNKRPDDGCRLVRIIKTCDVGIINDARVVARGGDGGDGGGSHQWTLIDK